MFSNNTINTISIDSSGNIWVGTDSGICTYNDETGNEKYLMHSSRSNKYVIWAIFEDKNKNIWVGTDSGRNDRTGEYLYEWFHHGDDQGGDYPQVG